MDVAHVWQRKRDAFNPWNTVPTFKHDGCILRQREPYLSSWHREKTPQDYIDILMENMHKLARGLGLGCSWIFQQDNYIKHMSKSFHQFLKDTKPRSQSYLHRDRPQSLWEPVVGVQIECPILEAMDFGQARTNCNGRMEQNPSGDLCQPTKELLSENVVGCGGSETVHCWLMARGLVIFHVSFLPFLVSTLYKYIIYMY